MKIGDWISLLIVLIVVSVSFPGVNDKYMGAWIFLAFLGIITIMVIITSDLKLSHKCDKTIKSQNTKEN